MQEGTNRKVSYSAVAGKGMDKRFSKSSSGQQKPKAILHVKQQYRVFLEGEDVTPHSLYVAPANVLEQPPAQKATPAKVQSNVTLELGQDQQRQSLLINMQSLNLFQTKLFQQTLQAEQSLQGGGACMGDSMEAFEVPVYIPEQKDEAPAEEEPPTEQEAEETTEAEGEKQKGGDETEAQDGTNVTVAEFGEPIDASKIEYLTEEEKYAKKAQTTLLEIKPLRIQEIREIPGLPALAPRVQKPPEVVRPDADMPKTITVTLLETETYIIFDLLSSCADRETEDGIKADEENELYEYMTVGKGRNRKVVQAETQTPNLLMKNVATMAEKPLIRDQTTYVSNYVMHDTYFEKESLELGPPPLTVAIDNSSSMKGKIINTRANEEAFLALLQKESFLNALLVMERLLDTNVYHKQLKRYCSIVKQDITRMDMEYNFRLDLLWTYKNWHTEDRPVAQMCWNPANRDILAVGYGKYYYLGKKDGVVLIWNIKNPTQPERTYLFDIAVTSLAFCRAQPNLLAVGFYNGRISVLNIASFKICIITSSSHESSPCYEAIWQLRWFTSEEGSAKSEEILMATTQDGRVNKYKLVVAETVMPCFQVMRIIREEGKLKGATQYRTCPAEPITLCRFPPAVVFTPHPVDPAVYYVGTYEGTIHKCSKNNYHQHIEAFLAHNGPVTAMRFSPFGNKIFLTCGADWKIRIWAEGIEEPLIEFGYGMRAVETAVWHPIDSTIIASITGNEIHVWDIGRKIHLPQSITYSPSKTSRYVTLKFSKCGKNLLVADIDGDINVFTMEDMPIPPHEGTEYLLIALEKALITKPNVVKQLQRLGGLNWDKHSFSTIV